MAAANWRENTSSLLEKTFCPVKIAWLKISIENWGGSSSTIEVHYPPSLFTTKRSSPDTAYSLKLLCWLKIATNIKAVSPALSSSSHQTLEWSAVLVYLHSTLGQPSGCAGLMAFLSLYWGIPQQHRHSIAALARIAWQQKGHADVGSKEQTFMIE